MIHGYKYRPGDPRRCPHRTLLSPDPINPGPRIVSWPRRLGLRGQHGEGLGISFGWHARGTPWAAHRNAALAGLSLADVIDRLRARAPCRPVRIIAHSMGARVALEALARVANGGVDRVVLLAAAEFEANAAAALSSPGGQSAALLNVTSRENDLYDALVEALIAPPKPGDRVLGAARLSAPNLTHLQIDDARALDGLRRAGFPIDPPSRQICHWSGYLRPGLFPLYRAWLDGHIDDAMLRAALPDTCAPRWSRLRCVRSGSPRWRLHAPGA
jgi:pimeloyl-ACP methyl ester carboxylesterase